MPTRTAGLGFIFGLLLGGCGSEEQVSLATEEAFRWCDDGPRVAFRPPAGNWQRSKLQERETGVAFVRPDVPPGFITVGEFTNLCRQDMRPVLRVLWEDFDELSHAEIRAIIHSARRFENSGYTHAEDALIAEVNEDLTQLGLALQIDDLADAERLVDEAYDRAVRFEYELDDILDAFVFDPEAFDNAEDYVLQAPVQSEVDGLESMHLSYTMEEERGLHHGRKTYVAWDNHLFVFSYQGPEKYLPVYEAMMKSVNFPVEE